MRGDRYHYIRGRFSAYWVRRPHKPVPPHDCIRLYVGGKRRVIIYMRPDEALAIAGALMTACWHHAIASMGGRTK